jgi:hypothetical protein
MKEMRGCSERKRGATRFMLMAGIAAMLVASLFALPALASGVDGNGDRIPDRWELRNDLSLKKNQAPRDQDRDGVRNLSEYRNGTDPRDADTDTDGTADATDEHPCDHQPPTDGTGTGTGTVPGS